MASRHGNRLYVQVLFEPGQGDLFLKLTEKLDKKPAALLRELAYQYIKENTDELAFAEAKAFDLAKQKEAVDARLEGKAKKLWADLGLDNLTSEECSETPETQSDSQPGATSDLDKSFAE
tara:strand:- start:1775 stop:2134 length:360 start_codon:yes stop_codon:yes gene_type:complete